MSPKKVRSPGRVSLEHMVDTVLTFEGDKNYLYRVLRAVKNRFGSTDELGLFEMHEEGLVEVPNPSEMLLAERTGRIPPARRSCDGGRDAPDAD